ncbi:MAG: trehalose-6-phosphate synthase [Myxococcota bacterium]
MARARKLVVVSNRGPYRREGGRWVRSAGGLVAALHPMLADRGGVWVSAKHAKGFETVEDAPDVAYDLAGVALSKRLQEGFYMGVSNAIVWPLLHSFPTTMRVSEAPWKDYVDANQKFADVVLAASRPADTVWVQDYHLMLVPRLLRQKRSRSRIGWFCHVPWPPRPLFGILPWRTDILEGLLGADVLGFHTQEYADSFLECVDHYTDRHVDRVRGTVKVGRRVVRVLPAPIGIPVNTLRKLAASKSVASEVAELRAKIGDRKVFLGVDRLDYTKGIPERIRAFDALLSRSKEARDDLVFVQIMVPSRTDVAAYSKLKDDIDRLVGDLNGRYASTGTVPFQYFYRNFDQASLMAQYQAADVAVVTPLRDGMNLVAHEYVASRVHSDGVLILSEFAGAANYLEEAVLVNPYDVESIADAMERALRMSKRDKTRRMRSLLEDVEALDVHRWADGYLELLEHG